MSDLAEEVSAVRTKLLRSRTSCIKCRNRKAKCGALPPDTCAYCKKNGLLCVWPEIDGRKTRPRRGQSQSVAPRTSTSSQPTTLNHKGLDPVVGARCPTDSEATASAWLDLNFNDGNGQIESGAAVFQPASRELDTLFTASSSEEDGLNGPYNAAHQDPWDSVGVPDSSLQYTNDFSAVDPASFFRDLFDGDLGEVVQMQFSTDTEPSTRDTTRDGTISIKVSRAHGRTAFIPGRIKVPFKIHVQPCPSPRSPSNTVPFDPHDIHSNPDVLKHLLRVFKETFWQQVPCVDCQELEQSIGRDPSPSFLMNCVAAISARFSTDPRITLSRVEPAVYGDVYYERAHAMLGNVVKIPLRETVIGFTLLAYCADSSTGTWTMAGLATRMAVDLGLHRLDHPSTDPETARQNRLCFWSLLVLDTIVSVGVGRETTFRPEGITQLMITPEDLGSYVSGPPLIHVVEMMRSYGPLINLLNAEGDASQTLSVEGIRAERAKIMRRYHDLPVDMVWSAENLKRHNENGAASMFLHLHLWFHTVLSSSMVVPDDLPDSHQHLTQVAGIVTPSDKLRRSGARMVTEYLTLCDMLNPSIYYCQRFLGQPLFTAARVILQELQRQIGPNGSALEPINERSLTTSLLSSMVDGQIDVIRKVMIKTGSYWRGAAVVKEAIEGLVAGRREEDEIWGEDESYAIEMYAWSLPGKYRVNGAQVN